MGMPRPCRASRSGAQNAWSTSTRRASPAPGDIQRLHQSLRRRVLRLFLRRGLLDEPTVLNLLAWQAAGDFSVDASVRISGSDRAGRERLLRECARPPFALDRQRIERASPSGRVGARTAAAGDIRHVLYPPSRATPDGRMLLVLSPLEVPSATSATLRFLAALARLIPPPRVHRHCYHGVLAPDAGLRRRVTALAAAAMPYAPQPGRPGDDAPATPARNAARSRWARLIARIYEVLPLSCPDCGAEMRILAFLSDPFAVVGILGHLGHPARAPPLTPARSPPRGESACDADPLLDLDQTPAFDPTEPDPIADFDFDQTRSA